MHSKMILANALIVILLCVSLCHANDLHAKFEWNKIDFAYNSPDERQEAINSGKFIPDNVIPVGIDVHENRLFISLPRLKKGVPASLATINMNGENL